MDKPLISVVIPTFNSEKYLQEAIESVINQSYPNLEILILDDGSTDQTLSIIKGFTDKRIKLLESDQNKGQSYQYNKGILMANGEFVCVMHSDDIMHTSKLEKQMLFLEKNPLVGICGSNIQLIGDKAGIWLFPEKNQDCRDLLLSTVPVAHPSVLFTKSVLKGINPVYNIKLQAAEDYDLWVRLACKTYFGNVQEVLLDYRVHEEQLSVVKKDIEENSIFEIRKNIISNLFKIANNKDVMICLDALYYNEKIEAKSILRGVILLWQANNRNGIFSSNLLNGRLNHIVFNALSKLNLQCRLRYLLKTPVLFRVCFFRTIIRIVFLNYSNKIK